VVQEKSRDVEKFLGNKIKSLDIWASELSSKMKGFGGYKVLELRNGLLFKGRDNG
jgi:hypothetical protein